VSLVPLSSFRFVSFCFVLFRFVSFCFVLFRFCFVFVLSRGERDDTAAMAMDAYTRAGSFGFFLYFSFCFVCSFLNTFFSLFCVSY
jgi:hypothetical protein